MPSPDPTVPPLALRPVARRSLSDAVFEQLRDSIVGGSMAPGDSLPAERALAEVLGVNRGAVREALKRLAQARLVAVQHGGASRVLDYRRSAGLDLLGEMLLEPGGQIDVGVVRSVMEMRSAIAPDIARLAAQRATPAHRAALAAAVERMSATPADLAALQTGALAFWSTLVDASGNLAYRLAYNSLRRVYERCLELLAAVLEPELTDLASYRALVQAVESRDPDSAGTRARALVRQGEVRMAEVLERLPPAGSGATVSSMDDSSASQSRGGSSR